jgi:AcrR family transcriptional regulator
LFAKRGYAAVSMRELAEAVGMRQGGIYNHFAGKQALLADLMETHMVALLEGLEDAMSGLAGPKERLTAFARNHVAYHLDYPDDVFLAYMEIRSLEPKNRARIIALRDQYEAVLRDTLAEGQARGDFQISDAAVHTRMLLAMMTGATVWYADGGRLTRDQVVNCYLKGALQSVGLKVPS